MYHPVPSTTNSKADAATSAGIPAGSIQSIWFVDSAASTQMTNEFGNLQIHEPYHGPDQVTVGDGTTISIQHPRYRYLTNSPTHDFSLNNLLHVSHLSSNLLSVHQLTKDDNCTITFDSDSFVIQDNDTQQILSRGLHYQGLYHLPSKSAVPLPACSLASVTNSTWHQRLGHPSSMKLDLLAKRFKLGCTSKDFQTLYTSSCVFKSHRLPFCLSSTTSNQPLSLIHSDVWGPLLFPLLKVAVTTMYCLLMTMVDSLGFFLSIKVML